MADASHDHPLTIIQVGASDGQRNDPLRSYLKEYPERIRAILVEPLPQAFAALEDLYAGHSNVTCVNAAVSDDDGSVKIFTVSSDCPYEADQLSSMSEMHLRRNGVKKKHVRPVEVKAITLAALLSQQMLRSVDLFQIDTEGYDYAIVTEILQLDADHLPQAINFEFKQLPTAEIPPLYERIRDAGYDWTNCDWDTFCLKSAS